MRGRPRIGDPVAILAAVLVAPCSTAQPSPTPPSGTAGPTDASLANEYDVGLTGEGVDLGFGGSAHGSGNDFATGFMEKQADDRYRGRLEALSKGDFKGEWGGSGCARTLVGTQILYVVGTPIPGGNVLLRFYPDTPPDVQFTSNSCPLDAAWEMGYEGGEPDFRPPGAYLPFGDSAWTNPLVGHPVWLPSPGQPVWLSSDDSENSGFGTSVWSVETRYVGPGAP